MGAMRVKRYTHILTPPVRIAVPEDIGGCSRRTSKIDNIDRL